MRKLNKFILIAITLLQLYGKILSVKEWWENSKVNFPN